MWGQSAGWVLFFLLCAGFLCLFIAQQEEAVSTFGGPRPEPDSMVPLANRMPHRPNMATTTATTTTATMTITMTTTV